jgi:glycosyltransferase involved in cell wall biosynthesis
VNDTLRVAFDASSLLETPTGVGTFVVEVLKRLAARHDVSLIAYALTGRHLDELANTLPAGVPSIRRPLPYRFVDPLWRRFDGPVIERWTGRVDVVHGPNYVVPPARDACELVSVHDLTALKRPDLCDDTTVRFPHLIRRALARGAHVQTGSRFVADEVVDAFGVHSDRVHPIHYGAPGISGGDAGRGHELAGGDRYVLAVGTIEPRKNLAMLVQAFDALAAGEPHLRLVLAGGNGWRIESFEATLGAARHRDRVVRLGRVSEATKRDLLRGASVLAYPSLYEGFGFPPLEAMSAGVPVVATSVGSLPEVLGDGALLVPVEVDALTEALALVLTNESLRVDLVRRGHDRVARYSWDRCTDELVALYGRLADR